MVKVSDTAKLKLAALMQEEGKQLDKTYISVGVESGGCSGLSYKMDFTPEMPKNAELYEDNGVKVVVEKKSLLYLIGTTLEYSGGLNGKGFSFNNPNATRTCGCGESFAV
ncbi:MAG: iron-sulfur cluster assembly accessory protein [Bacteroidetes bacterium]|nr:iron-sulfur cluster assembly accessory protein [Bacteroidota bacterium]MDA0899076.1 iron-sulfur cluster assembly accessory protein [Bacteroidota bacterium]